jgi:hypothetical protein
MKSSHRATLGYFDQLAEAQSRAMTAERRLAEIETMLAAGQPKRDILAALRSRRSTRERTGRALQRGHSFAGR